MSGLSEGFEHYLPPTEEEIKVALRTGLIVLDTNVLLEAYRFAPPAREELLTTLEHIGDRLWIPYQVRVEFHKNRFGVMASKEDAYQESLTVISELLKSHQEIEAPLKKLRDRTLLPVDEIEQLTKLVVGGVTSAIQRLEELRSQHAQADSFSEDEILPRLQAILEGKVGGEPSPDALQAAKKEALERVSDKRPPGYADAASKADPSGDYLVWHQTLEEAARRKVPLILVTRDAKEDWFLRAKGKTIAGRPELIQEARAVADVRAIIMLTQSFLLHARNHLATTISEETLAQAAPRNLPISVSSELRLSTDTYNAIASYVSSQLPLLQDEAGSIMDGTSPRSATEVHELEKRLDRFRLAAAALAHAAPAPDGSGIALRWSSPLDDEWMVRLATQALAEARVKNSPTSKPVFHLTKAAAYVIGDDSPIAIGRRVTHPTLGTGRIAHTRVIETQGGPAVQVELFLDTGAQCWINAYELASASR